MPTVAERLATIQTQLLDRIESVTASNQPSYTDGNRTVSKAEYLDTLFRQLDQVEQRLARSEPVEVITRVGPV